MNKKTIFTALALGGAIVYCLRLLTQSKNKQSQPFASANGSAIRD